MKTNYLSVWICVLLLIAGFSGCDDMNSNIEQYMQEYNYSGKVTKLRYYIGYERVILAWDNPTDQKSKTILIEYDTDKKHKTYDTLVDSVSIDGLTSGSGYDFSVYTQDASGNLSVPVSITALPISEEYVKELDPPTCTMVKATGGGYALKWSNLSSILMRFAGKITYQITGKDGFTANGEINVDVYKDVKGVKTLQEINDYTLPVAGLKAGVEYTVTYNTSVWPISSKIITVDIVTLPNTSTVKTSI